MKLAAYLQLKSLSDIAFAEKVGRSRWAVRKWMYGQRVPRPQEMRLIAVATDGAVTANDFMPDEPTFFSSKKRRKAA